MPITFAWRGDAPSYPKGYITLGALFWAADRSRILTDFGMAGSSICWRYFPNSGQRID